MQIPKFFFATCVLGLGLTLTLHADDNPEQAAARAAVAAKLSEMEQMSPDTNTVTVVPPPILEMTNAPAVQKPAEMNSDISQNAPAIQTNSISSMGLDTNSLSMQTNSVPNPPMGLTIITNEPMTPAPKKIKKTKMSKAAMATNAPAYTGQDLGVPAMAAPVLPISATKEQKLDALDAQYKADQISPEEYFKQRAAILNGE
jgi:hypothetical protein